MFLSPPHQAAVMCHRPPVPQWVPERHAVRVCASMSFSLNLVPDCSPLVPACCVNAVDGFRFGRRLADHVSACHGSNLNWASTMHKLVTCHLSLCPQLFLSHPLAIASVTITITMYYVQSTSMYYGHTTCPTRPQSPQ